MPEAPLQIIVGDGWQRDVRWLVGPDAPRLAGGPNLDVLHAAIDIVVGRRNVTRHVPAEPLLPFLDRWTSALAELADGASKVVVYWEASPWHLAMQRVGPDDVALTLFRLGHDVHVELDDAHVPRAALVDATRAALTAALVDRMPAALSARLRAARDRLEPFPADAPSPAPVALAEPLVVRTRSVGHGALETALDVGYPGIAEYHGQPRLDRHGCIAPGTFAVVDAQEVRIVSRVRPLVLLEGLVDALHAWAAEGVADAMTRVPLGDATLELHHGANRAALRTDDRLAIFDADAFVRLVADHAEGLVASLWRAAPPMSSNDYVRELRRAARELRRTVRGVAPVAQPAARSTQAGANAPTLPGDDPTTLGFPVASLRRLRFARDWSRRISRESAMTWRLAGDVAAVGIDDGALVCLDRRDGTERWQTAVPAAARWSALGERSLALVARDRVVALELEAGAQRWSRPCAPDTVFARGVAGTVLLADAASVRAVDGATGHERWRWSVGGDATPRRITAVGATVCVALSTGRVVGLRHGDGRLAWSWQGAAGSLRLGACDDRLGVWTRGRGQTAQRFRWIDATDGAVLASLDAPGTPRAWHVTDDGFAAIVDGQDEDGVVVGDAGGATLRWLALERRARGCLRVPDATVLLGERTLWCVAADGQVRWEVTLPPTWRDPRLAERNDASGVVVVRHDDAVVFYEAYTGAVLGDAPAFWEEASRLHVGADGGWLLVEDGPGHEGWLHGVPAVGMLAALDGGRRD